MHIACSAVAHANAEKLCVLSELLQESIKGLMHASKTDKKGMWKRIVAPNYACIKEQHMRSREKRFFPEKVYSLINRPKSFAITAISNFYRNRNPMRLRADRFLS